MTRNPIRKVLSTLRSHRVRHLLIGGQACVFYGGAEFSRDTDIVLLAEPRNLLRLARALKALEAECIAVPPFLEKYLHRGHAIHFRCHHPQAESMRLDVMSVLRNVKPFAVLWRRRTTYQTEPGEQYELLSLPDLVQAKKTQRDKDWLMLHRLLEAHYAQHEKKPKRKHIDFWLEEMRTIDLLAEIARQFPVHLARKVADRPLLAFARAGNMRKLADALRREEETERERDRLYWAPLKAELQELRSEKHWEKK